MLDSGLVHTSGCVKGNGIGTSAITPWITASILETSWDGIKSIARLTLEFRTNSHTGLEASQLEIVILVKCPILEPQSLNSTA